MFRWGNRTSHLGRMKNSSYYIAPVGDRTHDLPHTVASNMVKVSHALNHSAMIVYDRTMTCTTELWQVWYVNKTSATSVKSFVSCMILFTSSAQQLTTQWKWQRFDMTFLESLSDVGVGWASAIDQQSRVGVPLSPQMRRRSRLRLALLSVLPAFTFCISLSECCIIFSSYNIFSCLVLRT